MKQLKLTDLKKELKDLEVQQKKVPNSNLLIRIKKIRNEINLLYTQEMIFVLQKYYKSGYKNKRQIEPYTK